MSIPEKEPVKHNFTVTGRSPWTAKVLWLIIPAIGGAMLWWWSVNQFISGRINLSTNAFANVSVPVVLGLLGLGLWLGSTSVTAFLATWRSLRVVVAMVAALPLAIFFSPTLWTGAAVVVTAVSLFWSGEQSFGDIRNRLTVQPLQTLNQNLAVALTGAMVAVAILSYQQVTANRTTPNETTKHLAGQMVNLAEPFLPSIYHGYRPDMTVDELISSQLPDADKILQDINFDQLSNQAAQQQAVNQKIQDLGLDPKEFHVDVRQGTAALRQHLTDQLNRFREDAVIQAREELSKRFGIPLAGDEHVHDALTDYVNQQLSTSFGKYTSFLPLLLAVGVFLLLRVFSFLYTWIIVGWGWLWISCLRWFKVVKIVTTTVPAQHLEWS